MLRIKLFILIKILIFSFNINASTSLVKGELELIRYLGPFPNLSKTELVNSELVETIVVQHRIWRLYELTISKVLNGDLKLHKLTVAYEHWSVTPDQLKNATMLISDIDDSKLVEFTGIKYKISELIHKENILCVSDEGLMLFPATATWDKPEFEPLYKHNNKKCYSEFELGAE